MKDQFSEEKQSAEAGESREEAINEAMRCLLEDLSELSSAVEQLEQSSSQGFEHGDLGQELPLRK